MQNRRNVPRGTFPKCLQATFINAQGADVRAGRAVTSGAKARVFWRAPDGTAEAVPFHGAPGCDLWVVGQFEFQTDPLPICEVASRQPAPDESDPVRAAPEPAPRAE